MSEVSIFETLWCLRCRSSLLKIPFQRPGVEELRFHNQTSTNDRQRRHSSICIRIHKHERNPTNPVFIQIKTTVFENSVPFVLHTITRNRRGFFLTTSTFVITRYWQNIIIIETEEYKRNLFLALRDASHQSLDRDISACCEIIFVRHIEEKSIYDTFMGENLLYLSGSIIWSYGRDDDSESNYHVSSCLVFHFFSW